MKLEEHHNNGDFEQIVRLIESSRSRALRQVNIELVTLYFEIGRNVSQKVANGVWGEKTVDKLADFIKVKMPELKGFTRRGLYRMKQFYETYSTDSDCFDLWLKTHQKESSQILPSSPIQLQDEQSIRKAALQYNVPCVTTMTGAEALIEAIATRKTQEILGK